MRLRAPPFARDTRGAVSVDWAVLTAAVLALALLAIASVATGTGALSRTTAEAIEAAEVGTPGPPP